VVRFGDMVFPCSLTQAIACGGNTVKEAIAFKV
jgi:hypothetical protein